MERKRGNMCPVTRPNPHLGDSAFLSMAHVAESAPSHSRGENHGKK